MRKLALCAALAALVSVSPLALAKSHDHDQKSPDAALVKPQSSVTTGSVSVEGHNIDYKAVAGTLVLHKNGDSTGEPTVSMFYTAYFKKGAEADKRPVTFIYNGGPGSATVWLHMGAWGPQRIVTADHTHTAAAPYKLVNNKYSLLDASDLVFIDAPGAGFSRLIADAKDPKKRAKQMKERKKKIYSVNGDAHAFAQFIQLFLSKYGRWNSPKYLFGESYGTTRSAVLSKLLENRNAVDLNGVILLSQILNFDLSIDGPERNPGVDLPYALGLPTFAATAWYHHKLPNRPAELKPFLDKVEHYALTDYMQALLKGNDISASEKQAVAQQLHEFTGLPVNYLLKADLRVNGAMFEHELLTNGGDITGRLDSRFKGPAMDPMAKGRHYDPQSMAISAAYVGAFNNYVRKTLDYGKGQHYRLFADIDSWDFHHTARWGKGGTLNVMGDLARTMKANPNLQIMLAGGYYDLATPYFTAEYEMKHLPIPASLEKNISFHWYPSGHMVYAHVPSLKKLHDDVAKFIDRTDNVAD
ncbi:MAG TPA: peptidase S10 [Oleiagrimonas sp.]|nr:peptidase S10 [Oleiagrimonas sp.]